MAQLKSLSINGESVADYPILRKRTTDGRVYTKWSSGRSTMEARLTVSKDIRTSSGSGYISSTDSSGSASSPITVDYDSAYFSDEFNFDDVHVSVWSGDYPVTECYGSVDLSNHQISFYLWSPISGSISQCGVNVKLVGRWK